MMEDAQIVGPRIGLCSNQVHLESSILNTDGKGCKHDTGLGAGVRPLGCQGSGGAHGGSGGLGGVLSGDPSVVESCQ